MRRWTRFATLGPTLLVAGCLGGTIGGSGGARPGAPGGPAAGGDPAADDPGTASASMPSSAVQLTFEPATGAEGQTVTVALDLVNGGAPAVTALTLDVQFDAASLAFDAGSSRVGAAAEAAGKSFTATSPAPGMARLILFGVNATPIGDGVLATLSFTIAPAATLGPADLAQTRVAASDAAAQRVSVSAPTGAINITP